MAVVALIPTGRLEHAALAASLERLFPDDTFLVRPPEQNLDGFTSCDVAALLAAPAGPVPGKVDELADALVGTILPGRRGEAVDFAFVVEDLELVNDHQPDLAVRAFREAVERSISDLDSRRDRIARDRLREHCSFHLFRPMVEAYFFGDPAALVRAGASRAPQLAQPTDLEQFRAADREYLDLPPGTERVADPPLRERHPKAYLHFLCDPTLTDRQRRYRETRGGVAALRDLNWVSVVAGPPHCPFLHALLDDLSAALNHPLPFTSPVRTALATRFPQGLGRLLRKV